MTKFTTDSKKTVTLSTSTNLLRNLLRIRKKKRDFERKLQSPFNDHICLLPIGLQDVIVVMISRIGDELSDVSDLPYTGYEPYLYFLITVSSDLKRYSKNSL